MKNIGNINNKNIGALLNSSNIYYEGGGKTLNDIIYPVGAVIIRVDSINPSTWYGGTWELLCPGRTLVCIDTNDGNFNTIKKTGGEKTHKLTVNEMPKHSHRVYGYYNMTPQGGNYVAGGVVAHTPQHYGNYPESTGGDAAHNNLQPYMVVYIWVRTA